MSRGKSSVVSKVLLPINSTVLIVLENITSRPSDLIKLIYFSVDILVKIYRKIYYSKYYFKCEAILLKGVNSNHNIGDKWAKFAC